jgi:hypothetical protein
MNDIAMNKAQLPAWVWLFAGLGLAWNIFGIVQLVDFTTQTQASLMMKGMTPSAAALYYGLPAWMKFVFATGSIGGLIGSLLLGARRSAAVPVFAVSLAGYVALFAGDFVYGVFNAIPGQMAVLLVVVAVAVALMAASLAARRQGLLG